MEFWLAAGGIAILGSSNAIAGKIKAQPLGECNAITAVANAFVHTLLYGALLGWLTFRGHGVAPKQLEFVLGKRRRHGLPVWTWLIFTGTMDSLGNLLALLGQPHLSGPLFSLMNQLTLPSAALISCLLGQRFAPQQLWAIALVMAGAAVAVVPSLFSLARTEPLAATVSPRVVRKAFLVAAGTVPTALSNCIKERLFQTFQREAAAESSPMGAKALGPRSGAPRKRLSATASAARSTASAARSTASATRSTASATRSTASATRSNDGPPSLNVVLVSCLETAFQLLATPLTLLALFGPHKVRRH